MLKMTDVSKVYPGGSVALQNVDIHIEPGEFVFVVGPSGAGKSTFIKMLFREVLPTTGSIFVNGVDILSLTPNEIPYMRRQLGIIFQDYRLLPDRTVYENVAFAMEVIETPRRKIKRRVLNVLDLVGLRHRANAYPNELSGGEQQRIAIARAIVNDPIMVIADEPTGNLDPETSWDIMEIFKEQFGFEFEAKAVFANIHEFIKHVTSIKEVQFTSTADLFSQNQVQRNALMDLTGVESPSRFKIITDYKGQYPIKQLEKFLTSLDSEAQKRALSGLVIKGDNESGIVDSNAAETLLRKEIEKDGTKE